MKTRIESILWKTLQNRTIKCIQNIKRSDCISTRKPILIGEYWINCLKNVDSICKFSVCNISIRDYFMDCECWIQKKFQIASFSTWNVFENQERFGVKRTSKMFCFPEYSTNWKQINMEKYMLLSYTVMILDICMTKIWTLFRNHSETRGYSFDKSVLIFVLFLQYDDNAYREYQSPNKYL